MISRGGASTAKTEALALPALRIARSRAGHAGHGAASCGASRIGGSAGGEAGGGADAGADPRDGRGPRAGESLLGGERGLVDL